MSIFDKAKAVEELQQDRLPQVVKAYLNGVMPSASALWRDLLAAEGEAARKLGVSLEPVEVFPMTPPTPEELAELGGKPFAVDPGYEMEGGWLGSFQWASLQLRRTPLIKVHSIKLVYPTVSQPIYDVPLDWIYPDHKAGILQFTPKPTASGIAPSIIGANLMSRGATVPQMVRVRYSAGLTPDHPRMGEIIDLVMRMAVLKQMKKAFLPTSTSISADGMSQSKSLDMDKYSAAIDDELADLRESIRGPLWSVL